MQRRVNPRAYRVMWVHGRYTYAIYTLYSERKHKGSLEAEPEREEESARDSPSRASVHAERLVHYDSCIYIRSKNIPTLCRRAPPGISSENNILMYVGVLPLALTSSLSSVPRFHFLLSRTRFLVPPRPRPTPLLSDESSFVLSCVFDVSL